MKNVNLTLNEVVPEDIRFSVYKKALDIYKDKLNNPDKEFYGMHQMGLCLLLPCILWDLEHYMDDAPDGSKWHFLDTGDAFPEVGDKLYRIRSFDDENLTPIRVQILEEILINYVVTF